VVNVSGGRPKLYNRSWNDNDEQDVYTGKVSKFTIDCYHLGFDVEKFRPVQKNFAIPRYFAECEITTFHAKYSVTVYPLRFMAKEDQEEKRRQLVDRDRKFLELAAVPAAHREYRGLILDELKEEVRIPATEV